MTLRPGTCRRVWRGGGTVCEQFKKDPLGAVWWAEAEARVGDRMAVLGASLMGLEDGAGPSAEGLVRGWERKRGVKGSSRTFGLSNWKG